MDVFDGYLKSVKETSFCNLNFLGKTLNLNTMDNQNQMFLFHFNDKDPIQGWIRLLGFIGFNFKVFILSNLLYDFTDNIKFSTAKSVSSYFF